MTPTTTTTLTCPTMIQGVIGGSFCSLVLFCLWLQFGTGKEFQSQSIREDSKDTITLEKTFH